mgnify:CR=1 FL=1
MKFGPLIAQEESKSTGGMVANPVVGTWDLSVRWGKGGDEKLGRHILTIKPDLSGEIKDVEEGWANPIRNLKATQQDVAFDFYYGDKEEYLIEFEGKVKKNAQGKDCLDNGNEIIKTANHFVIINGEKPEKEKE